MTPVFHATAKEYPTLCWGSAVTVMSSGPPGVQPATQAAETGAYVSDGAEAGQYGGVLLATFARSRAKRPGTA